MAQKKNAVASTTKKTAAKTKAPATKKTTVKPATAATTKSAVPKTPATAKASATVKSPAKKSPATAVNAAAKPVKAPSKASAKPPAKAPAKAASAKAAPAKKPAAKPARTKVAAAAKAAAPTKTAKPRTAAPKVPGTPMTPKEVAARVAAGQRKAAPAATATPAVAAEPEVKKPVNQRGGFKIGEHVVYPSHGVGQIVAIDEQEIAGLSLELFVITFEKDKMTLRVPTGKCESVGMRKLAVEPVVAKAMSTLKGKARVKRTMWSRRAQEYEAKINSGDLVAIAEVVRDLYRSETQPEQSYSERQLYEQALERMGREIAAVEKLDDRSAVQRIVDVLSKSAKGRRQAAEDAEAAESGGDIKAA